MTQRRILQWTVMATAVICSLWFYPQTLDPFNITKLAVLVVGAGALVGLIAGQYKTWWSQNEALLYGVVGLFLVGLTLAGLNSDRVLFRTLWGAWARNDGWFAYAALAVVLLGTALAFRGSQVRFGMYALIGVGLFEICYALLQTTGNDPVAWSNGYNPIIGTVGNPNFASALLGISGVAMAWLALRDETQVGIRIGSAVSALAAAGLTVRSDSIQGTLAFGAGVAILIAGWLSEPQRSSSFRALLWPYVAVVGLGGLMGALGFIGTGPLGVYLDTQNLKNREYYWKTAWNMFQDHKFFGVGLDSLGDFYRTYRAIDPVGAPGFGVTTNAAHSIVFQLLAVGGLAVGGTFLLLQAFVAWRGFVALRSGENRLLVSGVFGAWAAFFLQSLFSIDQLGLTVWGWVLGGLVIGASYATPVAPVTSKRGSRAAAQRASNGLMLGGVLAVLLGLGGAMLVAVPLSKDSQVRDISAINVDTSKSDQVAAAANAVLAAADGADDPYWQATLVGKMYQIGAVADGIALAEKAVKMFPDDPILWNLIAIAYEQTGRASQAIPARTKTVELDPLNTDYQALLAQDKAAK